MGTLSLHPLPFILPCLQLLWSTLVFCNSVGSMPASPSAKQLRLHQVEQQFAWMEVRCLANCPCRNRGASCKVEAPVFMVWFRLWNCLGLLSRARLAD
jgi:hypothetical protein